MINYTLNLELEEVTFEGDGRFKYRDIELKRGTKIGGGTYGDIFMLEPTNNGDKDKIPPLVIKQFKKVGSKEDPEIDFVRISRPWWGIGRNVI